MKEDLGALAAALGHTNPALYETPGGRFFMVCGCGWKSTTRRTMTDAVGAGVHHAKLAIKEYQRNGVSGLPNRFLVAKNQPER
jgi:hypothetical protein